MLASFSHLRVLFGVCYTILVALFFILFCIKEEKKQSLSLSTHIWDCANSMDILMAVLLNKTEFPRKETTNSVSFAVSVFSCDMSQGTHEMAWQWLFLLSQIF